MLKKDEELGENDAIVEEIEINENIVNYGDNLPLNKSIKKKKPGKKVIDDY